MGLDMYLERTPIIKGKVVGENRRKVMTPDNFNAVDSWFDYQDYLKKPLTEVDSVKCSWEQWTRNSVNLPDEETIQSILPYRTIKYWEWDNKHEYPHSAIMEQVGYWRKANAIHEWFVNNIQGGEDDCEYHRPINKYELEELVDICKEILDTVTMDDLDKELAKELLPTQSGFFFGGTEYDEWYIRDLEYTVGTLTNVLETTDFNTQMIYYVSSW